MRFAVPSENVSRRAVSTPSLNGVDRLFLNVGAGGGVMFFQPRALFPPGHSAAGKVDVGLEYFTRLRHLSLGLALEGLGALPRGGTLAGGALSPFVRYTF